MRREDSEIIRKLLLCYGTAALVAEISRQVDHRCSTDYRNNPEAVIHSNAPILRHAAEQMMGINPSVQSSY